MIAASLMLAIWAFTGTLQAQQAATLNPYTRTLRASFNVSQAPSSSSPDTSQVDLILSENLTNQSEADSLLDVANDSLHSQLFLDSDSLSVPDDSTRTVVDTLKVELPPIVPPDSTQPKPVSLTSFRLVDREFHRHGYKDALEAMTIAPGFYPRQTELYGQPAYAIPSGGSARDLTVMFRGRPYNEPITGATNFTTFEPEEIKIAEYNSASVAGIASSGPVLNLIQPYVYETVPRTRIVYRQGWYGLGRADWRIAHQLSNEFAYHIGINVSEFKGRYSNTYANTSNVRIGARRTLRGIGQLAVQWMEFRDTSGRPFDVGTNTLHRNDFDISLSSGVPGDSLYRELGLWYVRSISKYRYGDEDGNRLGIRFEQGYGDLAGHNLGGRVDVERIAARFVRRPSDPDPQANRLTAGFGLTDEIRLGQLRIEGALRTEYSTLNITPDTASVSDDFLTGGSLAASFDLLDSLKLIGLASSSWRYPNLDELAGYWSVRSPDRWMDAIAVPDYTNYSLGNPSLRPVKSEYIGAGLHLDWLEYRQFRVMNGLRQWRDQIIAYQVDEETWKRRNGANYTTYETTAYTWLPVYGPVTVAGSFTYAKPITPSVPVPDSYGWASARFMDHYYWGQLRIRATATAYYWGEYQTETHVQDATWTYELLLNAKIFSFEAYFGTRNLMSSSYDFIPGYPNLHREEIWGVRWVLFE